MTGTEHICRAVLAAGVRRLVHSSSWMVYGMDLGTPAREDATFTPFQEPYARTKAAGDRLVQRMIARDNVPAVIIRPGTFFGPGDRLHFARMADRVRKGTGIIVGSGNNALPFVYVTDVVQGMLLAAQVPEAAGRAYNITHDEPLTQEEFLRGIAEELGTSAPRVHVPYRALYACSYGAERVSAVLRSQKQPIVTRLDTKLFGTDNRHAIDKARAELGYTPQMPLREGIHHAAKWYVSQRQQATPQAVAAA